MESLVLECATNLSRLQSSRGNLKAIFFHMKKKNIVAWLKMTWHFGTVISQSFDFQLYQILQSTISFKTRIYFILYFKPWKIGREILAFSKVLLNKEISNMCFGMINNKFTVILLKTEWPFFIFLLLHNYHSFILNSQVR